MGNLKNKRKRVTLPPPCQPSVANSVEERAQVLGEQEDFLPREIVRDHVDLLDDSDLDRQRFRREYAREWQRKNRARLVEERARENVESLELQAELHQNFENVLPRQAIISARSIQRSSAQFARNIVSYVFESLRHEDLDFQQLVLEKVFCNEVMKVMMPSYLQDLSKVKHSVEIINNLKRGLSDHLTGNRAQPLVMAKDIVCTLATSQSTVGSAREVARVLGVDRRNIKRSLVRRESLDSSGDAFWRSTHRAKRADTLSAVIVELVVQWWTFETTVSPNRKDIATKRVGRKSKIEHPKHYLQVSQLEFFTAFKTTNPDASVMLTSFHKLKPWFVYRLKEWNTCTCRYHTELRELLTGLNDMRSIGRGVHGQCQCFCVGVCNVGEGHNESIGHCGAHVVRFKGLTELWTSILCPIPNMSKWYKRECLMGQCDLCGVKNFKVCPSEMTTERIVRWRRISYVVVGKTKEGREKKSPKVEYMESIPKVLIEYLKPKLKEFVIHNFISRWQEIQFKEMMTNLPQDTIMSCIDFSQNYAMQVQNEIQSMHWHSVQITILVHITYRHNPAFVEGSEEPKKIKEVHYYISDEPEHDSAFVQHAFRLNWQFLQERRAFPHRHVVWSDGCSAQFKSATCWYHLGRYHNYTVGPELPEGCQLAWNYFASGHGKGEVDGAGALLKRELRKEQIKPNGVKIQNASDVVGYLKQEANKYHAAHPTARRVINKHFWLVQKSDIDRSKVPEAATVKGSLKAHQVRSVSHTDPTLVKWRDISCFCFACEVEAPDSVCDNGDHVQHWTLTRMRPINKVLAREAFQEIEQEVEFGSGGQQMADDVCIGDNVAVICDSNTDEDFWILLIDKAAHILDEDFQDEWKQQYFAGDSVVRGLYYERLRPSSRTYYLLEDHPPAYVYSHLVISTKFNMPPTAHSVKGSLATYELTEEVSEIIHAGIEAYKLDDEEE